MEAISTAKAKAVRDFSSKPLSYHFSSNQAIIQAAKETESI
jgi:hypothetical protein